MGLVITLSNTRTVLEQQDTATPLIIGVPGVQGPPGTWTAFVGVNGDVVTLLQGQPVMVTTGGVLVLARSTLGYEYVGLVNSVTSAPGAALQVLQSGVISQPQAQWNAITGNTGGLALGMPYFLHPDGTFSSVLPSSGPLILVGVALSSTVMQTRLGPTIL